ncbi:MAG: hypothetical protein WCK63_14255 [Betaproteobacteria bacterium]
MAMMAKIYAIVLFVAGPLYLGLRFGVWSFFVPTHILIDGAKFAIFLAVLWGTANWILRLFFGYSSDNDSLKKSEKEAEELANIHTEQGSSEENLIGDQWKPPTSVRKN